MDLILRIMYPNKIEDYDLSTRKIPVKVGPFQASPAAGGWNFRCGSEAGMLQAGSVVVIDEVCEIAALVLEKTAGAEKCVELRDGLTIGRKADNDIVLRDSMVSGHHCVISRRGNGWMLQDQHSTNGTYINDKRVASAALKEGDIIKLGRYRFCVGKDLQLENADDRVTFRVPARSRSALDLHPAKPYPWFSRAPRLLYPPEPLTVNIEDAPTIGMKPAMGMGSLSLNPASMLMSMANQALRFGLGKRKYSKQEKLQAEKYAAYLTQIEARLQEHADAQRAYEEKLHPTVQACMGRVNGPAQNLWERQPGDADFLTLRLGVSTVASSAQIKIPQQHLQLYETELEKIPGKLAEKYASVENVPVCCDLRRDGNCGIIGARSAVAAMAKNMIAQLAALHSCDEVKIVILFPQQESREWEWARWLPHCQSDDRNIRYLISGSDSKAAMEVLERELQQRLGGEDSWERGFGRGNLPHYVFIVADPSPKIGPSVGKALMRNDPELGVSGIFLGRSLSDIPHSARNMIDIQGHEIHLRTSRGETRLTGQDPQVSSEEYDRFARTMAPIRLLGSGQTQQLPESISFLEGMGISGLDQLDLGEFWGNSCNFRSMAVPIAIRANGEKFLFDIHERAHGPHGLVAGTTGSGKSEMVMSWILSMALHFSPQEVSFVLIDFKGTGLILPFEKLPHLAGTISDLDSNISRNLVALNAELERRKALFDGAGVNKISDYLKLYRSGQVKEPLPYLFVVIDEYAEFKAQFPDFNGLVNSLFRTGRSLGVHILLLTQNPSGVVSAESESNVRFRWCLKVASAAASKEMLGNHTEAAYLTNPGRAYVQVGSDEVFEEVQSFYSGAPYQPDSGQRNSVDVIYRIGLNGARTPIRASVGSRRSGPTQISAVVDHIRAYAERHRIPDARRIWQDRMKNTLYLHEIPEVPQEAGELLPIVGMVDDPARQLQEPMVLPLSSGGHAVILGGPGSGKTVFLHTLAYSLCTRFSPEQVNIYAMDFGSWTMGMFRDYPHVCAIANSNEEEALQRIAEALTRELQHRKECFAREGAGNLRTYLRLAEESMPHIVLMVDKYDIAKTQSGLEEFFLKIGREGANYGIYLVLTAGSTTALGFKLEQNVKTKLALQMNNPADYISIVGKTGGLLPERVPGRGLVNLGRVMEFQTALPVAPDKDGTYVLAIREMGKTLLNRWGKPTDKTLRVMPETVAYGTVAAQDGALALGIRSDDLKPMQFPMKAPHYLLISGTPGSGKTTLLKTLARQMTEMGGNVTVFCEKIHWQDQDEAIRLLETGAEADAFLEELRDLLTRRQAQKGREFEPVCFLIDGYRRFFDAIAQQSVDRMKALLMAGGGLGVFLVAADTAASLAALAQYHEPVVTVMSKGPAVLLGGRGADHLAVNLNLSASDKTAKLKPWEGWLRTAEETARFKAMNCE